MQCLLPRVVIVPILLQMIAGMCRNGHHLKSISSITLKKPTKQSFQTLQTDDLVGKFKKFLSGLRYGTS